jgi:hypothetical protein
MKGLFGSKEQLGLEKCIWQSLAGPFKWYDWLSSEKESGRNQSLSDVPAQAQGQRKWT